MNKLPPCDHDECGPTICRFLWTEKELPLDMDVDFSNGRAIGTQIEINRQGEFRICLGIDASVKLSTWHKNYAEALAEAVENHAAGRFFYESSAHPRPNPRPPDPGAGFC